MALICGVITSFFWRWGSAAHWTSDGPGILVVMAGTGFFGLLTVGFGLASFLPESWIDFFNDN